MYSIGAYKNRIIIRLRDRVLTLEGDSDAEKAIGKDAPAICAELRGTDSFLNEAMYPGALIDDLLRLDAFSAAKLFADMFRQRYQLDTRFTSYYRVVMR